MTKNLFYLTLLFSVYCLCPNIAAAEQNKPEGTILNISVSERVEAEDDLLIANLRFEFEDADPRLIQSKINKNMKQAIEIARKMPDISVSTEQYNIYKYYPDSQQEDKQKKEYVWHGSQGLRLSSKSPDNILKITGELQHLGMLLSGLSYVMSEDKMEEIRDNMMEAAIEKLRKKSQRAAKALGKSAIEITQLNIDANNYIPYPLQARGVAEAAYGEKMAAPVAGPGRSQIMITISATVLIKD